jgi:hypothetical protein
MATPAKPAHGPGNAKYVDARHVDARYADTRYADTRYVDAAYVVSRLEEAGASLLALPGTGWTTKLRTSSLEIVRTAIESYGWSDKQVRPPIPSAARISRMDEALGWIPLIPLDRYVLRRIVGARSLVNPITDRYLFPWRRLAAAIGADHKAVQRWHGQGIDMIVAALNRPTG